MAAQLWIVSVVRTFNKKRTQPDDRNNNTKKTQTGSDMSQTDIFFGGSIIMLVGWLIIPRINNRLTADRERKRDIEARRRDSDLAISEFTAILKKWLDLIGDRQQTALAASAPKHPGN